MTISNKFRLCACGCGHSLSGQSSQKFASSACRQADYRKRHQSNSRRQNSRYSVRDYHTKSNANRSVCTILFDKDNKPVSIEFHKSVEHAQSYINDMKSAETFGRKFALFLSEVFCNEKFTMSVTPMEKGGF